MESTEKQHYLDTVALELMKAMVGKRTPSNTAEGLSMSRTAYSVAHIMWDVRSKGEATKKKIQNDLDQAKATLES